MNEWNLFVCGDFEDGPLAINVSNPKMTTSELKSSIAQKIDVPEKEISLYLGKDILPAEKPLAHCDGLRGGAGVVVVANPLRIKVQRYDSDVDTHSTIPRLEAPRWKTEWLFSFILFKTGMPDRTDGKYFFAVEGTVLKEKQRLSNYGFLKDDFTISVSFLLGVQCQNLDSVDQMPSHRIIHVPLSASVLSEALCYGRKIPEANHERHLDSVIFWHDNWRLTVQQINGTRRTVELEKRHFTSIYELRMKLSPEENIRLTLGTTVLEDWDEEGNLMLLCNYPEMHDGANLYQVNLTGGIRVKYLTLFSLNTQIPIHDQLHVKTSFYRSNNHFSPPAHIYIEDPYHFSVKRLIKVFQNCGSCDGNFVYVGSHNSKVQIEVSDDPVSSVALICDGCTLSNFDDYI